MLKLVFASVALFARFTTELRWSQRQDEFILAVWAKNIGCACLFPRIICLPRHYIRESAQRDALITDPVEVLFISLQHWGIIRIDYLHFVFICQLSPQVLTNGSSFLGNKGKSKNGVQLNRSLTVFSTLLPVEKLRNGDASLSKRAAKDVFVYSPSKWNLAPINNMQGLFMT